MSINYRVLCITDRSDLPETELFVGLHQAGVDIEVMCNPTGKHFYRLQQENIPTHQLIIKSRYSSKGRKLLKAHFQKHSYDIVYCFNNHALTSLLLAASKEKFKVVSYRGIVGNLSPYAPGSWLCHLNPRVTRIVCVCNAVRDHIRGLKAPGIKIPDNKPVTIYKGHDISWYEQAPADLSEFKLPKNAFVVSFAGRDRPRKGLRYLIDAANHLPPKLPIYFLLMGNFKKSEKLKKKIDETIYRKNFIFTGFREDAPAVMRASDVFVLPSTKREGLARAVIEAMASCTVPIVSNVGGLPELVKDKKTGYVIPAKNGEAIARTIMKLVANPKDKEKIARAAQKRIQKHFHTSATVQQTRKMFEDMLK